MGNCFSSNSTIRPLANEDENGNKLVSSSRNPLKTSSRTSKSNINMSDFMGIKKSDSIDNFYEIE
jgi:hypothetical protein